MPAGPELPGVSGVVGGGADLERPGTCFTSSLAAPREEAWRCTSEGPVDEASTRIRAWGRSPTTSANR
jgi:hypothetical protein